MLFKVLTNGQCRWEARGMAYSSSQHLSVWKIIPGGKGATCTEINETEVITTFYNSEKLEK